MATSEEEAVKCHKCNESCTKDYIKALGHTWHLDHFTCGGCDEKLGGAPFFEQDDKAFCKDCYKQECAPKCACCQEGILGDVTTALGKSWIPAHFVCKHCKKCFASGEGFLEKDGFPYCKPDYYELFKPKCSKCVKPITDKTVTALEQKWHPDCFVCNKCNANFPDGRFFVVEDKPYCAKHRFGDKEPDEAYDSPYVAPVDN